MLELGYLPYRRRFVRLMERLRYQFWTAGVSLSALHAAGADFGPADLWRWVALLSIAASVDLGYRLLDRFWLSRLRSESGRLAVPKLVRDLAAWILLVAAVLVAGHVIFDVAYKEFLLPTTVISAVLGFALQDVLKNIFAGLSLQSEAPFDTGDWLVVDGEPRQVLEMTWRSTHLRNSLGVEFREPNANIANARIVNLGSGSIAMGFEVEVGVAYGAPPRQVKDTLERAVHTCSSVAASPPAFAHLAGFGDSAVLYRLRFWSTRVHSLTRTFDEVRTRVWYQLKRDGFTIPFPIRTVEYKAAEKIVREQESTLAQRALELLGRIDFLAALPEEPRQRLAAGARHRHYDAGEKLVVEGEHGDSLLVLARGAVSVSKSGADIGDSTVQLAELHEGDFVGEMSLLTGAPRSATVSAEGAVEVFELDRAALAPVLQRDPALAETLSRVLGARVAATVARFEDRRDALSKTAAVEQRSILSKIRNLFGLG